MGGPAHAGVRAGGHSRHGGEGTRILADAENGMGFVFVNRATALHRWSSCDLCISRLVEMVVGNGADIFVVLQFVKSIHHCPGCG